MLSAYLVIGVSWRVMACFCVRVEFMPSIISSRLTASCVALSIVFGLLCKKCLFLAKEDENHDSHFFVSLFRPLWAHFRCLLVPLCLLVPSSRAALCSAVLCMAFGEMIVVG